MPERLPAWTRWLWLSAAVVVLDLATKGIQQLLKAQRDALGA